MVIYTEQKFAEIILKIRKGFGLENKTKIIIIEDIYNIEADMFKKMQAIEHDHDFISFRYRDSIENTAKYCYLMLLKWWFVSDASKELPKRSQVAWVDFGYNHGGERYVNSDDFSFLWEYDFPNKINAFCHSNPNDISVIDALQYLTDCFSGGVVVIPCEQCDSFWESMKKHMSSLLDIGVMDDDQLLILMDYKQNPDKYNIQHCGWFDVFLVTTSRNFELKEQKSTENVNIRDTPDKGVIRIKNKIIWCVKRIIDPYYPHRSYDWYLEKVERKILKYYGKKDTSHSN